MDFNQYQQDSATTAVYPSDVSELYCALKLAGEAGEVAEKIGKMMRDKDWRPGEQPQTDDQLLLAQELGDVLWYVSNLARELDIPLNEIAELNLQKLQSRQDRGTLQGSGDSR